MPACPRINPIVLRYIVAEFAAQGIQSATLFRGMGFTAEVLNTDPFFVVSHRQASDIIQRGMQLTRDGGLGHKVGRRRTVVGTGFAGLGFLTSSSLREATRFIADHTWAFGTLLSLDSGTNANNDLVLTASLPFSASDIEPFMVDELFASLTQMFRSLTSDALAPRQVDLVCAMPLHGQKMMDFFGCPLRFKQAKNRLILDAATADTVPASADRVIHQGIVERLEHLAQKFPASDICSTVAQALRERADNPPTLAQIAALLNTSERTLRRRLRDQDTSYQQLLDGVRKEQALALLRSSKAPISSVTQKLGFSDARNFRRAIQRWTGFAPSIIRKSRKTPID